MCTGNKRIAALNNIFFLFLIAPIKTRQNSSFVGTPRKNHEPAMHNQWQFLHNVELCVKGVAWPAINDYFQI